MELVLHAGRLGTDEMAPAESVANPNRGNAVRASLSPRYL
jgi:hypothetical protein